MNLVVSATGMLGSEICRQLAAKRKPIRALVRSTSDPAKVKRLRELGAEIALGDVRDRASLDAACQGATAVISTVSAMPFSYHAPDSTPQTIDQEGLTSLIAAAKAANVSQFIYTSFTRQIDVDCTLRICKAHRREAAGGKRPRLHDAPSHELHGGSGSVRWRASTIRTPEPGYLEMAISPSAGSRSRMWRSSPSRAWTIRRLGTPSSSSAARRRSASGRWFGVFEEIGGRPFELDVVPVEALVAQRAAADEYLHSFASLMLVTATHGSPIDMREMLRVFPIKLTSVREYAARALGG